MLKFRNLPAVMLLVLMAAAGCSDDAVSPPPGDGDGTAVIEAGAAAFEFDVACADSGGYLAGGPYRLRGANLRYDEVAGALAVDLAVYNAGQEAAPEPVRLVLLAIMPYGVTVIGSDNGETGPGAEFMFEFANDDGMWTPGEESFPRTVMFAVEPGVSVAFAGEIHVGPGQIGGSISGAVWNDLNGDGLRTRNEPGVGGVTVSLTSDGMQGAPIPLVRYAVTDPVGGYRFESLPAGYYDVAVEPIPGSYPTTPELIHVLLAVGGSSVADFYGAHFGLGGLDYPVITVPASADATIRRDHPLRLNDNYGLDPHLDVGGVREDFVGEVDGSDGIVSLLRFDLPEFAAPIEKAWLDLSLVEYVEGTGQRYELQVHRVVDSGDRTPWIEGNGCEFLPETVGSVNVNEAYGVAWVGAGDGGDENNVTRPDFLPEIAGSTVFHQDEVPPGSVISIEVTELVQGWIVGQYPNYGLVLRDVLYDGAQFKQIRFASRDFNRIDLVGPPYYFVPRIRIEIATTDD